MAPNEYPIHLIDDNDTARLAHFGLALNEDYADNWKVELLRGGFPPDHWMPRLSTPISSRTRKQIRDSFDTAFVSSNGRRLPPSQSTHLTDKHNSTLRNVLWQIGLLVEDWVFSGYASREKIGTHEDVCSFTETIVPNTRLWLTKIPDDGYSDIEIKVTPREVSILLPIMQRALVLSMQQRNALIDGNETTPTSHIALQAKETSGNQTVLTAGSTPSAGTSPTSITSDFENSTEPSGHRTGVTDSLTERVAAQHVAISDLCEDFRKTNNPENEFQLELFIRLLEAVLARLRQIENKIGGPEIEPELIEPVVQEAKRLSTIDDALDTGEQIIGRAERGVSLWSRARRLGKFFQDNFPSFGGPDVPSDPGSMGA